MRSIRAARAAILAFLGIFAAVIMVAVWRSPPSAPTVPPPRRVPDMPAEIPVDGPVESATETFLFTEEKGGVVVTRLQAGRMLGIEGGNRVLSDILIEFRPEPTTRPQRIARVQGSTGRFDASAHEVILGGGVHVRLATGEELQAPTLAYRLDERLAHSDGEVHFMLAGARGTARGLTASLQEQTVHLVADVRVTADGPAGDGMRISAESLDYDGILPRTSLHGVVEIQGAWGRFQGRDLVLTPLPGGGAQGITAAAGWLRTGEGTDELQVKGAAWEFRLDDARRLKEMTATGEVRATPAGRAGGPLRSLTAARLRLSPAGGPAAVRMEAQGTPAQPVTATVEHPAVTEVSALALRLEPQPDGTREALFSGSVRARGPLRTARGATLLIQESRAAVLRGEPGAPARLVEEVHMMSAEEIRFLADGGAEARGDIRIDMQPESGQGAGERLAAVGREATLAAGGDRLRLEGEVRAWQGESSLEAAWLTLAEGGARLTAGGGVSTSFRIGENSGVARASERLQVRSGELIWERIRQQARFQNDVRLVQGGASVDADLLVVNTDQDSPRAFQASGSVRFQDAHWRGSGDRLAYQMDGPGYLLESFYGLARVTSKDSGNTLTGKVLRVDPEGQAMQVESREGGRVTVQAGPAVAERQ